MKIFEKIIELIRKYLSRKLSSKFACALLVAGIGALAPTWWHPVGNWLTLQLTGSPMEPFKDSPVLGSILLMLSFIFFAINFWESRNTKNKEFVVIRHKTMGSFPKEAIKPSLSFFEKQWDYRELDIDQSDLYSKGILSNHASILEGLNNVPHKLSGLIDTTNDVAMGYYGISHIPLTFYLGFLLSGQKQHIRLFELKNNTNDWDQLKGSIAPLRITSNIDSLNPSERPGDIILSIGISYPILDKELDELSLSNILQHISIEAVDAKRELISSPENIEQISDLFVIALERIKNLYPNKRKVHLFYSGPVSLCFALGRKVSERIDSEILVYNYSSKQNPKYSWCLSMNGSGGPAIISNSNLEKGSH